MSKNFSKGRKNKSRIRRNSNTSPHVHTSSNAAGNSSTDTGGHQFEKLQTATHSGPVNKHKGFRDNCYYRITSELAEIIETRFGLLDELRNCEVFNHQQFQRVESQRTENSQRDQIIKKFNNVLPRQKQEEFLVALNKTQQSHVANFIRFSGIRPTEDTDDWPSFFFSRHDYRYEKKTQLVELIDTRNGLLDELFSVQCINNRQKQFISKEPTDEDCNETLLSIIERKSVKDYNKFLDCLRRTNQHHVAALLRPGSSPDCQPVSERHKSTLIANCSLLIDIINLKQSELLAKLLSADCITRRQKEYIESATILSESNRRLLDIVKRGSQSNFNMFINCLIESGQQQVVDVLCGKATIAELVAQTSLTLTEENAIIRKFLQIYQTTSPVHRQELLSELLKHPEFSNDCQLLAMEAKHSIKLSILCETMHALQELNKLYINQQLKAIVQQIFAALSDNKSLVVVQKLTWNLSNYTHCVHHMSSLNGLPVYSQIHKLASPPPDSTDEASLLPVEHLPHELIELLLIKAAGQLFVVMKTMVSRAHVYTLTTLHTVCRYWWETVTYRQFNRRLLIQYFKRVYAPYRFNQKRLTCLNFEKEVMGMAVLNDKLYVANRFSDKIQVFSLIGSSYCDFGEKIRVLGLRNPLNIVACSVTNCLFIADSKCIWQVNLSLYSSLRSSLNGLSVQKLEVPVSPYIQSLSVHTGRLLALDTTGYNGVYHYTACVYSCDGGELIKTRTYSVHDYVWEHKEEESLWCIRYLFAGTRVPLRPHHAVEVSDNAVVFCHTVPKIDNRVPGHFTGVYKLSGDGPVLQEYNGDRIFDYPRHMAMDSKKHILVCDDNIIVHLSDELKLVHVVLTERELSGTPWRMCYDEKKRLLYVCYSYSKHVDVFEI